MCNTLFINVVNGVLFCKKIKNDEKLYTFIWGENMLYYM